MSTVRLCINGREKDIPFAIDVQNPQHTLGILLSHGAGGDLSSGTLPSFASAFVQAGFPCLKSTCKGPLAHRIAVAKALLAATLPSPFPQVDRWILAGHSMGGRLSAQIAADLPDIILACVLISYPLHPPKDITNLRDDPLTQLRLPIMFVRGTNDPFSEEEPWNKVVSRMQAVPLVIHKVEEGGHGLLVPGDAEKKESAVHEATEAVKRFLLDVAMKRNEDEESNKEVSLPKKKRRRKG